MSWRDGLHLEGRGSFRGVEFYVQRVTGNVGRRVIIRRYPGRDDPGTEDNGREPRSFTLECYVLGDGYMARRDELRRAFEQAGPGPLVHPYWGGLTVVVDGTVRIQETPDEGGLARFTLRVVEIGDTLAPVVAQDTAAVVDDAADTAAAAVVTEFEDDFSVIGYIADVLQAAINLVNAVVSDLNRIRGYVNAVMAVADAIGDAIETLADTVTALILLPGQLVAQFQSVVQGVTAAISNIGDAWDSYFTDDEAANSVTGTPSTSPTAANPVTSDKRVDLLLRAWRDLATFGEDLADPPTTTPQRVQEGVNQTALTKMIRTAAVIEVARTIAALPFGSATKARVVRDELFDALDELADDAGDTLYGPLITLRTALVDHLDEVTAALPSVVPFTPAVELPVLVLSQQLYGTAARETDLVDRNNLRNPCVVPAFEPMEVLSDE